MGREEFDKQVSLKGEAAGWQHLAMVHNIAFGNIEDDAEHNLALVKHAIEYLMILAEQGYWHDEETGLTYKVVITCSNDLKALGLWFARGGSSDGTDQHCVLNEVHRLV